MRSIGQAIRDAVGKDDIAKTTSPRTQMGVALAQIGKPTYEGTVPAATIAKRRRRNKAARLARRAARR